MLINIYYLFVGIIGAIGTVYLLKTNFYKRKRKEINVIYKNWTVEKKEQIPLSDSQICLDIEKGNNKSCDPLIHLSASPISSNSEEEEDGERIVPSSPTSSDVEWGWYVDEKGNDFHVK